MTAVGSDVYLSAGEDSMTMTISNELWRYSTATNDWQLIGTTPIRLEGHAMTSVGSDLYLHGGSDGESLRNELMARLSSQTVEWDAVSLTSLARLYDDDTVRITSSDWSAQNYSRWTELRLCSQDFLPCSLSIVGTMHRHAETITCRFQDGCTGITMQNATLKCKENVRASAGPLQISGSGAVLRIMNSSLLACAADEDGGSIRVVDGASVTMANSTIQGSKVKEVEALSPLSGQMPRFQDRPSWTALPRLVVRCGPQNLIRIRQRL